jgi:uncharacterized protein YacL
MAKYYPLISTGLLSVPIISKYAYSCFISNKCSVTGICSKRQGSKSWISIGSREAMGHTAIGIIAGLLMSPLSFYSNNEIWNIIRSIIASLIVIGFTIYNFYKRGIRGKHKDHFYQSSFFINLADAIVGIFIGYVIGYFIYFIQKYIQKDTKFFIVNEWIQIISYIILMSLVIYIIIRTINTRNAPVKTYNDCKEVDKKTNIEIQMDPVDKKDLE